MKKIISILLAAFTCLCLTACAPSDLEKAEEKMEKAGYSVVVTGENAAELLVGDDAEGMIVATKMEGGLTNLKTETVTAYLFESITDAMEYYKEKKDDMDDKDDKTVFKMSGKWVIAGTEQAVKDFTKLF